MTKKSITRVSVGVLVIAMVTALFGGVASAAGPNIGGWHGGEGNFSPPRAFYLSLGESTGFGLQWDKFYVLGADGAAALWSLVPDDWVRAACSVAGRDLTDAEWHEQLPGRHPFALCPR